MDVEFGFGKVDATSKFHFKKKGGARGSGSSQGKSIRWDILGVQPAETDVFTGFLVPGTGIWLMTIVVFG